MGIRPTYEELEQRVRELEKQVTKAEQPEEIVLKVEKRLLQIIHATPVPTFVMDNSHTITHCNKAFENLTGYSAQDLVGTRNQWKTFYPRRRPVLADLIVRGASEKKIAARYEGKVRKSSLIEGAYEAEDFFPNLKGGGKWLFFTAAPLIDDKGKVVGAIETLQDVTDRKNVEEALRLRETRKGTCQF